MKLIEYVVLTRTEYDTMRSTLRAIKQDIGTTFDCASTTGSSAMYYANSAYKKVKELIESFESFDEQLR